MGYKTKEPSPLDVAALEEIQKRQQAEDWAGEEKYAPAADKRREIKRLREVIR